MQLGRLQSPGVEEGACSIRHKIDVANNILKRVLQVRIKNRFLRFLIQRSVIDCHATAEMTTMIIDLKLFENQQEKAEEAPVM
jgi:hypothetical protein